MRADAPSRELQLHYYDEVCDAEFEIARPHNCGRLYQFLIAHKLRAGLDALGLDLRGARVVEVCCGSGMISEALVRRGARLVGVDLSAAAIGRARERARRQAFGATFLVADAERLPFPDRGFDVAVVHDGLHHQGDPRRAIHEMARVARRGVLVMEPAKAALTRLAVQLGVAEEVEEAGNPVVRLAPREVAACLRAAGFTRVRWRRSLMYYPHEPSAWFRWFDRTPAFLGFRAGFWLVDRTLGRWGNKLALAARAEE
jgi:SAM-dependent methyltransferase